MNDALEFETLARSNNSLPQCEQEIVLLDPARDVTEVDRQKILQSRIRAITRGYL